MPARKAGSSPGIESNANCSVDASAVRTETQNGVLSFTLPIRLLARSDAVRNIYIYARNRRGETTDWQVRGKWLAR
jgi:hypothetical protein